MVVKKTCTDASIDPRSQVSPCNTLFATVCFSFNPLDFLVCLAGAGAVQYCDLPHLH